MSERSADSVLPVECDEDGCERRFINERAMKGHLSAHRNKKRRLRYEVDEDD